jgi:hypothetical protein
LSRLVAFALTGFVALAAAGCGTTERERDVTDVAERFHAALEEEDGAAACEQVSEETQSELESLRDQPCEEAILTLDLPTGGQPVNPRVYETSAAVDLAEGTTDFLDEGSQGWTISAAGCKSTAPDQPYDCELKG